MSQEQEKEPLKVNGCKSVLILPEPHQRVGSEQDYKQARSDSQSEEPDATKTEREHHPSQNDPR